MPVHMSPVAVAPIVIAPKTERVQIARSGQCEFGHGQHGLYLHLQRRSGLRYSDGGDEDALNSGVGVALFEGTCASLPASGLVLYLDPFVVHTVNHEQYGTLFQ